MSAVRGKGRRANSTRRLDGIDRGYISWLYNALHWAAGRFHLASTSIMALAALMGVTCGSCGQSPNWNCDWGKGWVSINAHGPRLWTHVAHVEEFPRLGAGVIWFASVLHRPGGTDGEEG